MSSFCCVRNILHLILVLVLDTTPEARPSWQAKLYADDDALDRMLHDGHNPRLCEEILHQVRVAIKERDEAVLRWSAAQTELRKLRNDMVNVGQGILEATEEQDGDKLRGKMSVIGYDLMSSGKYGSTCRERRERKKRRLNPHPQRELRDLVGA